MKKDLSKYSVYTDLAIEKYPKKNKDIKVNIEKIDSILVTTNLINNNSYITIEFSDISDSQNRKDITKIFIKELKKLMNKYKIKKNDSCLVIGIGNINSTPDSLGPITASSIIVTSHLFKIPDFEVDSGYREVSVLIPNVTAQTGIDTYDIVESVVKKVNPKFIITIDALIAKSFSRINKVIQISDTGVLPGSGIGNYQKEISSLSLGIPVISIGIPTVVDIKTIINEITLDKKITRKTEYNLIITPKDIDFAVKNLTDILITGINKALHKKPYK